MTDLRREQDHFDAEGAALAVRRYRVIPFRRELPPIDVSTDLRWGPLALSALLVLVPFAVALLP